MRGGVFDLSIVPTAPISIRHFKQFQWVGEIEHRHQLWGHPGKIRGHRIPDPRSHGDFRGRHRAWPLITGGPPISPPSATIKAAAE